MSRYEENLPSWLREEEDSNVTDENTSLLASTKKATTPSAVIGSSKDYSDINDPLDFDEPTITPWEQPPQPQAAAATTTVATTTRGAVIEDENAPSWANEQNSSFTNRDITTIENPSTAQQQQQHPLLSQLDDDDENDDDDKNQEDEENKNGYDLNAATPPKRPRQHACHLLFLSVQGLAIFSFFVMILAEILPLIFFITKNGWNSLDKLDFAVRNFICFFCIIFILSELEWPSSFIVSYRSLHDWFSRGIIYIFIGLVGLTRRRLFSLEQKQQQQSNKEEESPTTMDTISNILEISSIYMIIGMGILYGFMGMICLKRIRDEYRLKYERKYAIYEKKKKQFS